MELDETQKTAVANWVREGRNLADVQRLLRDEYGISITYMDLRFLVDDLNLDLAEPEPEPETEDVAEQPEVDGEAAAEGETPAQDAELVDDGGSGNVQVEVDSVMRPGSLISGSVTFSDGKKMGWQLTSSGQLGLLPGDDPEYRPGEEDVQAFQTKLEEVLRQQGY